MSRKLVAGVGAVLIGVFAVWFVALRGGSDAKPSAGSAKPRGTDVDPWAKAAAKSSDQPAKAPRGGAPKWQLDVDREGPLRLEGQAVDRDGQPVGGATVWISTVPPRSDTTEADGTFSFDKLVGRTFSLSATAEKQHLIGGPVTFKLTAESDPVVIRMNEGAKLNVKVVDDAQKPISGAKVKVETFGDVAHETDATGVASFAPVHPGWVGAEATATGYAMNSGFATVGSAGATGELTITLHKGATVSGRVIDEQGKPLANVRVSAGDASPWSFGRNADEVTTDAKGVFSFPALARGSHTLHAVDGEHEPADSSPITVEDRPISNIDITMKTGGALVGRVVDTSKQPVPFATVKVAGTGARMWRDAARQATTDRTGRFELRGLTRTKLQARAESDTAASALIDVDLTTQVKAEIELSLTVSGAIAGIVVDEKGAPVTEVQVHAFPDILAGGSLDGIALAGMSSATTDGAGAFTVRGLPDGGYRLWAGRSSGGIEGGWGMESTPAKTGDTGVRIVLASPGTLVGTIKIDGNAVPSIASVQVGQHPPTPASKGAFTVKDLQPGKYDVTVRGPEFAEYTKHDVEIKPGETTKVDLDVARGRKLVGRVIDPKGAPVSGAKIKLGEMLFSQAGGDDDRATAFADMSGMRSAVSDQDGNFTIIGVPKKATNVMAEHVDRGRSLAQPVAGGTDDPAPVTLQLRGFGSISGKVTMKGKPLANVTISESSKGGGAQATFGESGPDGTFKMTRVPEGTHVLMAMQTGMMTMKSTSVTVQVAAGKETTVAIDIPVGNITLDVAIKAKPNNQLDAAQVFLLRGTTNVANAKQLTDGFFEGSLAGMKFWFKASTTPPSFEELVAGRYSVCSIPITGDLSDSTFQQRVQANMQTLKVYCKGIEVAASPQKQTATQELPAMTPLPDPGN